MYIDHRISALLLVLISAASCTDSTEPGGPGTVVISAVTEGGDEDANGYTVLFDGRDVGRLDADGSIRIGGLAPGAHQVELIDVAPNCDASPPGSTVFHAVPDRTSNVRFTVSCYPSGVVIQAPVEGLDHGQFYTVFIDGQPRPEQVVVGGSTVLTGMTPGSHTIRLGHIPVNCSIAPESQSVTVALRAIGAVVFPSRCVATHGLVEVSVTHAGRDLDLDGYEVSIGNTVYLALPTASAGSALVPPGTYGVNLSDVARNCLVTGGDRQDVTVKAGGLQRDTSKITFSVDCQRTWELAFTRAGTIMLATAEAGVLDGGPQGSRPAWSFDGRYLAWVCSTLICVADAETGAQYVSSTTYLLTGPAWSPDGNRIAYAAQECTYYYYYDVFCVFGLFHARTDLTDARSILHSESMTEAVGLSWSPDGSTIAFGCRQSGGAQRLCVVRPDGTGFREITSAAGQDGEPSWSPDGSRLVFSTTRFGGRELVTIKPDGTDLRRFDPVISGSSPWWAHDGRILFTSVQGGISVVNADGSGLIRLTTVQGDTEPSLRP